jgi:hypothetical protein
MGPGSKNTTSRAASEIFFDTFSPPSPVRQDGSMWRSAPRGIRSDRAARIPTGAYLRTVRGKIFALLEIADFAAVVLVDAFA